MRQRGIIQLVILILIAIILVSYFGIDLQNAFTTPLLKKNLWFTWELIKDGFINYVYNPLMHLIQRDGGNSLVPLDSTTGIINE
ncbi:MAG: hypothetical protein A2664_03335 [Candidatus Taylorbacteria bacterium RIFCSPHIGHO2_01_FULL_46_22b]|uniref:Uncharacterized protein n=1 Tax=Candidatus Taylorbacteria bacterium RIFCSPHIGHO2_01_FULL_46_22b TaxID=1802301 RepID=A0A1G2M170_9BACT|nr:MAG: hypothetical protein A2664_03335 [Candidatus Taylorbacteria bacterium RIFCSPHIGHO2_01_FULL_46_22b]